MKGDITPKRFHDNQSIDKLDRELYDPKKEHKQRIRRKIHGRDIHLNKDFKDENYESLLHAQAKYKLPTSLFKKIFLAVLAFFLLALVIAGISVYEGKNVVSEELILLEILGQPFVDGGEELELQVRVQNFNQQQLELPDLVLTYPKDSAEDSELGFLRRSLDNIGPGQRVIEEFDLTLFGQEGDIREIEATLEYRIEGSNSIFIKQAQHEVIIRSTPTHISIVAPKQVVRNQEIKLQIKVSSNSNIQINDTLLRVNYPRGFEFTSSSVPPDFNQNTWYIDNITDEPLKFEIIGRLSALQGQGQSFTVEYGKQNSFNKNQIETVFNSLLHTVEIQQSFIESELIINGNDQDEVSIRGGGDIISVLRYKNTLDEALENVVITLNLDGELYDADRVDLQNGFYNSSQKTITFDKNTAERLELLQPGEEGEFRFTLFSRDLVSQSSVLSNPFVEMTVDVAGVEINGKTRSALAVARTKVSANSDIAILPKTLHYEGAFQNSGPMPPKVDLPTTYTLVLQLTNSSNTITDAKFTTYLPSYIEWQNAIAPSVERNNISFDITTRKLTWNLGELRAGLGVGNSLPRELSLQVRLIPSASQIGNDVDLTDELILTGIDKFTGTELTFKKTALTNRLQNNKALGANGRVVE